MKKKNRIIIQTVLMAVFLLATGSYALQKHVERINVTYNGSEPISHPHTGYSGSFSPAISANGRYVVFESSAANLVAGDTNRSYDVFVRDRFLRATTRVSVDSNEGQIDTIPIWGIISLSPSISGDGRYVAFSSDASDMVSGDTNGEGDVFVRDLKAGTTIRVSVDSNEGQSNGWSYSPAISGDGRYVAFSSRASDMVSGDTNGEIDVFVRDLVAGTTSRVSVDSNEGQSNGWSGSPSISGDGRYVAFPSDASDMVSGDTNGEEDILVRDLVAGTTTRVSVDSNEGQSNGWSGSPSISGDGRYVAFSSRASNLVSGDTNGEEDIFVRDLVAGTTRRVSVNSNEGQSNGESYSPSISGDGRYVAFSSDASNLVSGDTNKEYDIFVRDLVAGTTRRVSVDGNEGQSNGWSYSPAISRDGKYVVFASGASDLVSGDTNGEVDIFISDNTGSTLPPQPPPSFPIPKGVYLLLKNDDS